MSQFTSSSLNSYIAGVRIDDQPIEGKRGTGTAGMEVQSLDVVLTRYRAAVDCKRELDPDFVVMAQCYVAEAANGGFEESLVRMKVYKEVAQVDWVQLTAPRSVEEVKRARDAVDGPFSIMQGYMNPPLTPTTSHSSRCTTSSKTTWSGAPAPGRTSKNNTKRTPTSAAP